MDGTTIACEELEHIDTTFVSEGCLLSFDAQSISGDHLIQTCLKWYLWHAADCQSVRFQPAQQVFDCDS